MHEVTAVVESPKDAECPPCQLAAGQLGDVHQLKLLILHLMDRFVNNEMLSIGGETLPFVMTIAGAIAVPTLIAAVFLFPSYHAFPPRPPVPNFWTQVCEHYFFLVYSMVSMGLVAVFEADLFFPEPLDTLILSPLPIPPRRMAVARVSTNLIFLLLLLLGMNVFTIVAYPPVTELHVGRLFLANLAAVLCGATFSAAACIGLQGILSCILSPSQYRNASVVLQCAGTGTLVSLLLTLTKVFPLLEQLTANGRARWFPPFWFLGLYESILAGPARLPQFASLAHVALWGTAIVILIAITSFPLAYIRRSRQAIEGSGVMDLDGFFARMIRPALHTTLLRTPEQRAVYHFIGQSLRAPKHRIYLAMYAGLGVALVISATFTAKLIGGTVTFSPNIHALEAAVPAVAFWTVAGLCSALASPADPWGGWVFATTAGVPTPALLDAVRIWVAVWTMIITVSIVVLIATLFPAAVPGKIYVAHLFIAIALSVLLPDFFLFDSRTIPFTEIRIPLNTDLAWILLRYIVLFPVTVLVALRVEPWTVKSPVNWVASVVALLILHSWIREANHRKIRSRATRSEIDELTGMLHGLGLSS